ncbi:MAG TPA: bifunctional glutamate N-acetyltransferase/amino-acid acetyltransferase ArgJ [Candidatus Dormibacteraeota bacterium]|nr:bifunctional glutamate N-acetyltransferase/amino-acid acetyltransferase ArgJ [Candidatus Dormibacteraeota bacterium]
MPAGFSFAAASCGIRDKGPSRRLDLGLIMADRPVAAAGVFTTNQVKAAPVLVSAEHLAASKGRVRAVVVNSGNANCATGARGMKDARSTAAALARELGCSAREILICSTGVIGVPLPAGRIIGALPQIAKAGGTNAESFDGFSRAIMTTDTRPKQAWASCRVGGKTVHLAGCAKGAGMIHPHMATMLAFIVTDAAASPAWLSRALRRAVAGTFNSITVDGDTSTNDTVFLLASGASGAPSLGSGSADERRFEKALEKVCQELALQIVADGEGAGRLVQVEVRGAPSDDAAKHVAETIANSPLVKTAFAGADPNWGRVLAAAGRAGVAFNPSRVRVWLADQLVLRKGQPLPFDEMDVHRRMLEPKVNVAIDLGAGRGRGRVWTCDLTVEYIRINASYRT